MKFLRAVAFILSVICLPPAVLAQNAMPAADSASMGFSAERLAQIGAWYEKQTDAGAVPGAVVAVARGGKLAYLRAIGHQDRDRKIPMRPDAIFWIASMTKPVTSVAAMMLVEEGKLDLDAPVAQYLPALKSMQVASETVDPVTGETTNYALAQLVPQMQPMTVRDLLRHTSGLVYPPEFSNTVLHRLYGRTSVFTRNTTLADFVTSLGKLPLAHQPGKVWEYSWGVDVLARVVEVASGQPFDQFLQDRIFGPLRMIDTGFYVPAAKLARLVDPPPGGRDALWDVTKPTRLFSGGAGLVSTAADYLRFCQMLLNGGELDGVRILTPETVQLMTTNSLPADIRFAVNMIGPQRGASWGLGFAIRTNPDSSVAPGAVGSFNWGGYWGTFFWIDPVEKLIAVQMIQLARTDNTGQFVRALRFLTYAALRNPEQASFTPPASPVTVAAGTLASYVGTYDFGGSVSASDKQAPGPTFVGTGIEVAMQDGLLTVRAPYPNGPASRAGVMTGDVISHIDDVAVTGLSLEQVQSRLPGPAGTQVHLRIIHAGQDSPVEVTVLREARGPAPVGAGMEIAIDDGVLRVRDAPFYAAAGKAGVMTGDIITHVDDSPVNGLNLAQVQAKLRGPVGTMVRLKLMHPGQDNAVEIAVLRESIVGLGMDIALEDAGVRVRTPYPNSAAARAGVMAGDVITHVDDAPTNRLNLIQVQGKLRGPVGTPVRLKITRPGQDSPVDVTVTREAIVGLGMEIAAQDGVLKVRSSSPNGTAAKAGVMAGDIITHVHDAPVNGLSLAQALDRLRGQADTPVRLRIVHRGQVTPLDVTVIRKMIRPPGAQLTARMEDGRLMIEPTGPWPVLDFDIGRPIAVQAISNGEFYVDASDHTRIAFVSDPSGKITGAILNPGPREIKGIRID
jgi:CubicO group peptidase (beta-lactamase class C family)/C-terminal processing protease CtpA/Prc